MLQRKQRADKHLQNIFVESNRQDRQIRYVNVLFAGCTTHAGHIWDMADVTGDDNIAPQLPDGRRPVNVTGTCHAPALELLNAAWSKY